MKSKNEIVKILRQWLENLRQGKVRDFFLLFLRKLFALFPHGGVKVMGEPWDYLIILDACRYDAFKKLNKIPGQLEKRRSRGSSTEEWLRENFTEYYSDVTYVSGNPFVSEITIRGFNAGDHFYKIEKVWKYGWDEHLGTTPPEEVTKAALRIDRKHPNKRKIIHYLQPHDPFIGEPKLLTEGDILTLWKDPRVKKAWMGNLKLVLAEVENLVKKLKGRIVITSDHGESFRNSVFLFRHPRGIHIKELVEVPWFIVKQEVYE